MSNVNRYLLIVNRTDYQKLNANKIKTKLTTPIHPNLAYLAFQNLLNKIRKTMEIGIVKWFNDAKGFGFIQREHGIDVFVHHSSIIAEGFRTLAEGDRVRFDIVEGPKGQVAKNVMRL